MRGRKPKPTAAKRLTGNPGRRPLNEHEPHLPAITPETSAVPSELANDPLAATEWTRLLPLLMDARAISDGDRGVLIAVCQQWALYQEAVGKWRQLGMVVKSPSGYPMVNPYLGIANKALFQCNKLWVELGLTPSSRSRVTALPEDDVVSAEDALLDRLSKPFTVVQGGKSGA